MNEAVKKGTLAVMAGALLARVAMVLGGRTVWDESMANYRSKALCVSIQADGRLPEKPAASYERSRADGVKTVTYVRKGFIPLSRYTCSIDVRDGRVIGAQTAHAWFFD